MGSSGEPLDLQGSPLEVQGQFFSDLGGHLGGPGTSFFDKKGTLDGVFSIPCFKMIPGVSLGGFVVVQGTPGT